jgi:hypothetical protein
MLLTTRRINAPAATIGSMLEAADAVVPRLRKTGPAERTRLRQRLANRIGWDHAVAAWDASYARQADMYD